MCSNYKDDFLDFISECSVRILPHNITEKHLTYFITQTHNMVGMKVSVIVWDRTQGWTLTRLFPANEIATRTVLEDLESIHEVYASLINQIDELFHALIANHPEYLKQTIHQFHTLERL